MIEVKTEYASGKPTGISVSNIPNSYYSNVFMTGNDESVLTTGLFEIEAGTYYVYIRRENISQSNNYLKVFMFDI